MEQSLEQNTINEFGQPIIKRQRMTPPLNERVMLYVRQSNEDVYTPLHVVPPTAIGLLNAVSTSAVHHNVADFHFAFLLLTMCVPFGCVLFCVIKYLNQI